MNTRSVIHQFNLNKLFYPESIAIVGATNTPGTVPYDMVKNIIEAPFRGTVYPVSPREKSIIKIRCYKYVIDIKESVDLAIIVFPGAVCHMALEQCGQKGIKAVVIISAGFREIGPKGLERENQLIAIAKKYDISFIGPNCLGIINTDSRVNLNASFARKMPEEGTIGFLSQSGALCTAVLDYAQARHIGFSKFISIGNKTDINETDLLYYLMEDEKTKVILLYLEEVTNGQALLHAAQEVILKSHKPILAIKAGRTNAGAAAAASHTGSLAGSDEICDAAFKQAGIIRCDNIEELFNRSMAFAYQPAPTTNKVAIITNAGGPGVLATDATIKNSLQLARFSDKTTTTLKKQLPTTANIHNPVDMIGDAKVDRYRSTITATLEDKEVAAAFIILTPQSMTDIEAIAQEIANQSANYQKPVYTSFMGEADVAAGINILHHNQIPHYRIPESMADALKHVFDFQQYLNGNHSMPAPLSNTHINKAQALLTKATQNNRHFLPQNEAAEILVAFGLPLPPQQLAKSKKEAIKLANQIVYPVVLKIMSDDIFHKSDINGIQLNLQNNRKVAAAYDLIIQNVETKQPNARINGILVTKMIQQGTEVIIGMKRDPSFGPVVMFGLGGIFVEIYRDVSFRVAPLTNDDAASMITQLKAAPLLSGFRGRPRADIESLKDCLLRISTLAIACPQIEELEINPLIVHPQGCIVADAKIILQTKPQ